MICGFETIPGCAPVGPMQKKIASSMQWKACDLLATREEWTSIDVECSFQCMGRIGQEISAIHLLLQQSPCQTGAAIHCVN